MSTKVKITTMLAVLAIFGCKSVQTTSAASGEPTGDGASASASGLFAAVTGNGSKISYITDPTLNNMNAFEVHVPSQWRFQGTLFQGGSCMSIPSPVYRATSPDRMSKGEQMPGMAWEWGTGPQIGFMKKDDCLPMKGPMSAQDFLKYFAGTLKVNYLGPEPVPAEMNARAMKASEDAKAAFAGKYAASHLQPPKSSRELARAIVSYQQGSVTIKGRLDAMVDCMESSYPGTSHIEGRPPRIVQGPPSTVDKCSAIVVYVTAPEGQYASVTREWDAPGTVLKNEDPWLQAWMQRSQQQADAFMSQMNAQTQATMRASAQNFAHDQQVRQNMHEQFMDTMQRGTDISMANTQRSMNARSTATSDWVDYALDRQTVMDTNTGLIYRTTNQVTVGGALQKVHGDGTPY